MPVDDERIELRRADRGVVFRIAVALLCIGFYAVVTGVAVSQRWRHYEILGIALQYTVLLGGVVIGLRAGRGAGVFAWPRRAAAVFACALFVTSAVISWRVSQGSAVCDEESYRFQALTFGKGALMAAPLPGSPEVPVGRTHTPRPIYFEQQILSRAGWYSMYPMGWPLALALPEMVNLGWLVCPILGAALLLISAAIARELFGPQAVLPTVAISALSPFFFSNAVGRMSHMFTAVLVAWATLFCIRGLKTGKLSRFGWMFLILVAAYHARPFTAFVASVVLGTGALLGVRSDRKLLARVAALAALAAVAAGGSIALYNWTYTGNPSLSPYALAQRSGAPGDVAVSSPLYATLSMPWRIWGGSQLEIDIPKMWRGAWQSTLLFAFPLLPLLVLYPFWKLRPRTLEPWILLAVPAALALYPLGSGSVIGQRYWFEGYFGIAVLGGQGVVLLMAEWRCARKAVLAVAAGLCVAQVVMTGASVQILDELSAPRREVKRLAETYRNCDCVVYIEDTAPEFYAMHVNPNTPDWPSARVLYAVDPGPGGRAQWARTFERRRWVVLRYDARSRRALVDGSGEL